MTSDFIQTVLRQASTERKRATKKVIMAYAFLMCFQIPFSVWMYYTAVNQHYYENKFWFFWNLFFCYLFCVQGYTNIKLVHKLRRQAHSSTTELQRVIRQTRDISVGDLTASEDGSITVTIGNGEESRRVQVVPPAPSSRRRR